LKIIPVIDVLNGVVVRGVAGDRDHYLPIQSGLTTAIEPVEVACAIREVWEEDRLYLADLDAIGDGAGHFDVYSSLVLEGFEVWLDAGIRVLAQMERLMSSGVSKLILGLETLSGIDLIQEALKLYPADRLVFSLDMKQGRPLTQIPEWETISVDEIAAQIVELGITQLILLDLADVGTGTGVSTIPLCARLKEKSPGLNLITGGGVKSFEDWQCCSDSRAIDGLLVASAIHNGRLTPDMLSEAERR